MNDSHSIFIRWLLKAYLWGTELLYHSFAWAYDIVAWLVSFGWWAQWRRDALDYLQDGSILELGFGTGALLLTIAERGYDVVGLELSAEMHRVTTRKLKRQGVQVRRIRGSSITLPFGSGLFDNVVSTFPSNYILQKATLKEIHRVLSPAGRVVVVGLGVRFKSRWKNWLTRWFLSDGSERYTELFQAEAEKTGFKSKIFLCDRENYSLPVLLMERRDHG